MGAGTRLMGGGGPRRRGASSPGLRPHAAVIPAFEGVHQGVELAHARKAPGKRRPRHGSRARRMPAICHLAWGGKKLR